MWPACCSRPPPGPSSSTQPGFTSRLSPPRTSVKLPPDTRMIRQISSSSASSYWPVWNRSAFAVTRPLHFSRSAFIRTPHSTVSFSQCTMPATCGQPPTQTHFTWSSVKHARHLWATHKSFNIQGGILFMKLSLIRSMTRSAVFELENGLCYRPAHPFTVQLNGETVYICLRDQRVLPVQPAARHPLHGCRAG